MQKTIIIGVTSSIAAFKTLDLIRLLKNKNYKIFVIMTPNAAQILSPEEFEKITGEKVFIDLFSKNFNYKNTLQKKEIDHITIAKNANLFIVVPATANTIAEIAHGIANNFLTTSILAIKAPVIICPAMNTSMWENPATQKNIATLKSYNYHIIEPTSGMLACGDVGKGKLENISIITQEIEYILSNKNRLQGKKILVTAGATKEKIDDVRFITNNSSGKMGLALAESASNQGAEVLLLRAESAVKSAHLIAEKTFVSSEELLLLLEVYTKNFDYIFHTAAVGDFSVSNTEMGKLPSDIPISLTLSPQKKLIDEIKRFNPNIHLIGFKAEYHSSEKDLIKRAYKKLKDTKADVIIANDVSKKNSGFGSENNEVYAVFQSGEYKFIPYASKREIAEKILQLVFPKK